jgi:hypothetical protein
MGMDIGYRNQEMRDRYSECTGNKYGSGYSNQDMRVLDTGTERLLFWIKEPRDEGP